MAAPNLQAEGATVAVTTGAPSVVIPTHQTDDIILLCAIFWGPATAGDAAQIPTPTNYTLIGSQIGQPAGTRDGWLAWFYRRAPSAGTTVTLTRGASWDTGADTCFGARAYVIRGCIASGDPWDAQAGAGPYTTANQAFPAVTVSGTERMVVQFGNSMDNAAFDLTTAGWTIGTEDDDATGTDCAFQTARKDNVSSSTSADATTAAAPAQGAYGFMGISFKPPPAAALFEAAVSAAATVAAVLTTVIQAAASIVGTAVLAGALTTSIEAAANISGTASVAAQLTTEINVAAAISGTGTVVADLTAPQQALLEASVSGASTVAGVLTTEIRMASAISGAATAQGALTTEIQMVGAVAGSGEVSAGLTTEILLDASAVGNATVSADLNTSILLASSINGSATATADLTAPGGGGGPNPHLQAAAHRKNVLGKVLRAL